MNRAWVLVLGVLGCSEPVIGLDDAGPPGDGAPVARPDANVDAEPERDAGTLADAVDRYCRDYGAAHDAWLLRCAGGTAADLPREGEGRCLDFAQTVAAGVYAFDPRAAEACVAAWGATCRYEQISDVCFSVFSGRAGPGERCIEWDECQPGLECWPQDDACGGICVRPPGLGDACRPEDFPAPICARDLACFRVRAEDPLRCMPFPGRGERCVFPNGLLGCAGDAHCDEAAGVCLPLAAETATCAPSLDGSCAFDLRCRPESDGGPLRCLPPLRAGDRCSAGERQCQVGLRCDRGTCRYPPLLGGRCDVTAPEPIFCAEGTCSRLDQPGVCVAQLPIGAPCAAHHLCIGDQCVEGVCVQGERCE